ncbi:MAG: hypothetical protein IH851_00400 [Armatimonadetes bacterium]|nr:hypothetical protein [Armatimonadota bacterium]
MAGRKRERTLGQARALLAAEESSAGLDTLLPYLERYGGDAEAHALAGVAYGQMGDLPNAEVRFKESLAIWEGQFEVSMMLLRVLIERRKWEDALPLAERLRKEHPSDKIVGVMLESVRENVERPDVGWERDENRPRVSVEFTGYASKFKGS